MTEENYYHRPTSSSVEQRPSKPEAPGSIPGSGSTFAYCVVRAELSGGALLAQVFHAGRECRGPAATDDERACILVASKSRLEQLIADLSIAGVSFKALVETDGPMAGSTPAVSFSLPISAKDAYRTFVGDLKPWRAPKAATP